MIQHTLIGTLAFVLAYALWLIVQLQKRLDEQGQLLSRTRSGLTNAAADQDFLRERQNRFGFRLQNACENICNANASLDDLSKAHKSLRSQVDRFRGSLLDTDSTNLNDLYKLRDAKEIVVALAARYRELAVRLKTVENADGFKAQLDDLTAVQHRIDNRLYEVEKDNRETLPLLAQAIERITVAASVLEEFTPAAAPTTGTINGTGTSEFHTETNITAPAKNNIRPEHFATVAPPAYFKKPVREGG